MNTQLTSLTTEIKINITRGENLALRKLQATNVPWGENSGRRKFCAAKFPCVENFSRWYIHEQNFRGSKFPCGNITGCEITGGEISRGEIT